MMRHFILAVVGVILISGVRPLLAVEIKYLNKDLEKLLIHLSGNLSDATKAKNTVKSINKKIEEGANPNGLIRLLNWSFLTRVIFFIATKSTVQSLESLKSIAETVLKKTTKKNKLTQDRLNQDLQYCLLKASDMTLDTKRLAVLADIVEMFIIAGADPNEVGKSSSRSLQRVIQLVHRKDKESHASVTKMAQVLLNKTNHATKIASDTLNEELSLCFKKVSFIAENKEALKLLKDLIKMLFEAGARIKTADQLKFFNSIIDQIIKPSKEWFEGLRDLAKVLIDKSSIVNKEIMLQYCLGKALDQEEVLSLNRLNTVIKDLLTAGAKPDNIKVYYEEPIEAISTRLQGKTENIKEELGKISNTLSEKTTMNDDTRKMQVIQVLGQGSPLTRALKTLKQKLTNLAKKLLSAQ